MKLHTKIFIGMIVGIVAGLIVKNMGLDTETIDTIVAWVDPVGRIFMNMIFMMVIPLILSALILGVAEIGDLKKLGRMGFKLVIYTIVVSFIAVMIGVSMVNIFNPGEQISEDTREYLVNEFSDSASKAQHYSQAAQERTVGDILVQIVPKNPLEEMANAFVPGVQ